jgi:hypothetical protein
MDVLARERRERGLPEVHVRCIASGLLALIGRGAAREAMIEPNPSYKEYALQHIRTGPKYRDTWKLCEDGKRGEDGKKREVDRLKSLLRGWLEGEELTANFVYDGWITGLAELLLDREGRVEGWIRVDQKGREGGEAYEVGVGAFTFKELQSREEVDEFVGRLRNFLSRLVSSEDFRGVLKRYSGFKGAYDKAKERLHDDLRLLALRLENRTEELDGRCKLCAGVTEEEEAEVRKTLNLFRDTSFARYWP